MMNISDQSLAAFMDGNTNPEETAEVLKAIQEDERLQQFVEISQAVESDVCKEPIEILPLGAMAASNDDSNRCAMLCELYILRKHDIECSEREWEKQARNQGWLKDEGMALYNIGRLLEQECFSISRTFHNDLSDIQYALKLGEDVIAVIDKKEITNDVEKLNKECIEDEFFGPCPNHAVVIESVDEDNLKIGYYDPDAKSLKKSSLSRFFDAWADSTNYLVKVASRDMRNYVPHPVDTSDVLLDPTLDDLQEAIAENAHEIWAENRQSAGWTYGSSRNDELKQTPDMVPYSDLPESEKLYDREMAMKTIKLLRKLGYDIVKCKDTDPSGGLTENDDERVEACEHETSDEQTYHCNDCGHIIYKYEVFCNGCGKKLDYRDFL